MSHPDEWVQALARRIFARMQPNLVYDELAEDGKRYWCAVAAADLDVVVPLIQADAKADGIHAAAEVLRDLGGGELAATWAHELDLLADTVRAAGVGDPE